MNSSRWKKGMACLLGGVFLITLGCGQEGNGAMPSYQELEIHIGMLPGGEVEQGHLEDDFGQGGPNGQGPTDDRGENLTWIGQPAGGPEEANPPSPEAGNPPSTNGPLAPPRGTITRSAEKEELASTFGVTIDGNYSDAEIERIVWCARQYRPDETKELKVRYKVNDPEQARLGVGGAYFQPETPEEVAEGGIIEIYDESFHTVMHEFTHHITLFPKNERAKRVAKEVSGKVPGLGTQQVDKAYVPSDYSMTDEAEYWAELFAFLRFQEKGVDTGEPALSSFNPPEDFRVTARKLYAN